MERAFGIGALLNGSWPAFCALATVLNSGKMILYSSVRSERVKVSYRIQHCTSNSNSMAGKPTENSMHILHTRSNDVDHLQNRMINIFRKVWRKVHILQLLQLLMAHENRLCYRLGAHGRKSISMMIWGELKKRAASTKSDNWNGEKRQPRSIALLYGNAHFDVFVAVIINGANTGNRSTCLRTVCFYSLLFTLDFFFHAIGHIFSSHFVGSSLSLFVVQSNEFFQSMRPLPYLGEFNFIYIATWTE